MVGTTVQNLQVVGWVPVTPVEGLRLPYWAGLWLGVFPTWEGLVAQGAAIVVVLGSYVRRRAGARAAPPGDPREAHAGALVHALVAGK